MGGIVRDVDGWLVRIVEYRADGVVVVCDPSDPEYSWQLYTDELLVPAEG